MSMGKLLVLQKDNYILTMLVSGNRLLAANASKESDNSLMGNIYIGKIQNIADNIEAAFVEITKGVLCFLPLKDVKTPLITNRSYDGKLKAGDEIFVQVNKDALKTKLPSVTSQISLTGQYCVLVMGSAHLGLSDKLPAHTKKRLLASLQAQELTDNRFCRQKSDIPPHGFVIRTNAGALEDFVPLFDEWTALEEEYRALMSIAGFRSCFTCLKQAPAAWLSGIQDYYISEYDEIVTDVPAFHTMLEGYVKEHLRLHQIPVRLYKDPMLPLDKLYSIESHLEAALNRRVWLKSGGYLIIEPTEALTVIDVNSGKAETKKTTSEEAYHRINLEAAAEIALQLRLRNLSGIIIADFINVNEYHQKELLNHLQALVKKDSVKTHVIDITPLGLMEITRKKQNKPLSEQLCK